MEKIGTLLFRACGVSEWEEKRIYLTEEEQVEILNSLKKGEDTDLVRWVKLPYPKFATEFLRKNQANLELRKSHNGYLESLISGDALNNDLIGYKLYMLTDSMVKIIVDYMTKPELLLSELTDNTSMYRMAAVTDKLAAPLEKSYIKSSGRIVGKEDLKKYIHIMSYIDSEEAKALGLESFTFYTNGEYRGFNIKEKLESLNPLIRHIFISYLGINGAYYSSKEICEKLNISEATLENLLNVDILLALSKSCGEFRNAIKYVNKEYKPNERIEYLYSYNSSIMKTNKQFAQLAERVEINYLCHNVDEEGLNVKNVNEKTRQHLIKDYAPILGDMLEERDLQFRM